MGKRKLFTQSNINAMEKHPELSSAIMIVFGIVLVVLGFIFYKDISIIPIMLIIFGIVPIIMGIVILYISVSNKKKHKAMLELLSKSNMNDIDLMDGQTFELFLQSIYTKLGYDVSLTRTTGDYGADLLIKTNDAVIAVQVKHSKNKIGISAVQEIIGAVRHYNATMAWVITNSFYTTPAVNLANTNNVKLIDRNELANVVSKINGKQDL